MKAKIACVACDCPQGLKGKRIIHNYKVSGLDYVTLAGIQ